MSTHTGVAGWDGTKQAALTRQIPNKAPSTDANGVVFQADNLSIADYQQCGGTGGESIIENHQDMFNKIRFLI